MLVIARFRIALYTYTCNCNCVYMRCMVCFRSTLIKSWFRIILWQGTSQINSLGFSNIREPNCYNLVVITLLLYKLNSTWHLLEHLKIIFCTNWSYKHCSICFSFLLYLCKVISIFKSLIFFKCRGLNAVHLCCSHCNAKALC